MPNLREEIVKILCDVEGVPWKDMSDGFQDMRERQADAILETIGEMVPKKKEFSPIDWGDGIIMNECTDEMFSIEGAKGWNAYHAALLNLLKGE